MTKSRQATPAGQSREGGRSAVPRHPNYQGHPSLRLDDKIASSATFLLTIALIAGRGTFANILRLCLFSVAPASIDNSPKAREAHKLSFTA